MWLEIPGVRSHFAGPLMCGPPRCPLEILDFPEPGGWFTWEGECDSFLFFGDLLLHGTMADLSHRREQVALQESGAWSYTHGLHLPGLEAWWRLLTVCDVSVTIIYVALTLGPLTPLNFITTLVGETVRIPPLQMKTERQRGLETGSCQLSHYVGDLGFSSRQPVSSILPPGCLQPKSQRKEVAQPKVGSLLYPFVVEVARVPSKGAIFWMLCVGHPWKSYSCF